MCTLSYIPTDQGYIFTHNRDERTDRLSSDNIVRKELQNRRVFFPQDLEANGTWMAYSPEFRAACILNGGEKEYTRKSAYRKSRGIMVLESFEASSIQEFYEGYNFKDIEPFTLILKGKGEFCSIIHDEDTTQIKHFDPSKKHIWSSTKLYSKEVRRKREIWFENWIQTKPKFNSQNVFDFHRSAGEGNQENDLVMSRWGILKTVSITQIVALSTFEKINYWDFVGKAQDSINFKEFNES